MIMKAGERINLTIPFYCPFCGEELHAAARIRVVFKWSSHLKFVEPDYTEQHDKPKLNEIEYRALVRHLRNQIRHGDDHPTGWSCLEYCTYDLINLYGLSSQSMRYNHGDT